MYPLLFLISIGSRVINTMGMVKNEVWFGSFFLTNHSFRFPLRRTLTHSVGCNRFSILVFDFIALYRKFYKIRYLSLTWHFIVRLILLQFSPQISSYFIEELLLCYLATFDIFCLFFVFLIVCFPLFFCASLLWTLFFPIFLIDVERGPQSK